LTMRNPSHQLNAHRWSKGHARSASMPAAAYRGRLSVKSFPQMHGDHEINASRNVIVTN
jgi:hypothetical protein